MVSPIGKDTGVTDNREDRPMSDSQTGEDVDEVTVEQHTTPRTAAELATDVSSDAFDSWYREREFRRNIRQGTPYFNGPGSITPAKKHSPSSLLQCKRKTAYKQLNAPEETNDPDGIFWYGSRFEKEIVLPFLEEAIIGDDEYVTNSLWIDFTVETDSGELRFRGETDPVIVTPDAEPIIVTEIKTKRSIENTDSPSVHHKAQAHAYMKGLTEKHDRKVTEAIILYGSRTTLDVRVFHIEFDPKFWSDTVVKWAVEHSGYRRRELLPPDNPEYGWECDFCSYSERCGRGDSRYADIAERGFLPGVVDYPQEKVVEYLEATDEARLTPTLAREYPELASDYEVCSWRCPECSSTFTWDAVNIESPSPACPVCADEGTLTELVVENPVTAHSSDSKEKRLVKQGE